MRLNVTVFLIDVDVIFLRNPFPVIDAMRVVDWDVLAQLGSGGEWNTGFYIVRPTPPSVQLFGRLTKSTLDGHDQSVTNKLLRFDNATGFAENNRSADFKLRFLDERQFPTGIAYYESNAIMFASDRARCAAECSASGEHTECNETGRCDDIVVAVHNSWIVTVAAKVYRFKETGQWEVDTDGYYSSVHRKYLAFDNPADFGVDETLNREKAALATAFAIGRLLDRVVILPTFHCHGCRDNRKCNRTGARCSLNAFFCVDAFDAEFAGVYREHVFLQHAKVPAAVRASVSPIVLISSPLTSGQTRVSVPTHVDRQFEPAAEGLPTAAITADEILRWFGDDGDLGRYSVLRFRSLYNIIDFVDSSTVGAEKLRRIVGKLSRAFRRCGYRQFRRR